MRTLVKNLLLGSLAGKALGVGREIVTAWCFGTGLVANAYRMSQAASILTIHGFVSDVATGAFTPLYARLRIEDPAKASRLFAALHAVILLIAVVVAIALNIFADVYIGILAPGFSEEASKLTAQFVRILAIALPAYVLITVYCAAELVHGQWRITSARASFQSVGLMVGTLAAWALSAPWMIATGFAIAYYTLAIWGCMYCRSVGLSFFVRRSEWRDAFLGLRPVWKVFQVLLWVPIGLQLSQIVERRVASAIHPGAVAGLDYARFATETLVVLVAMPFGMAGQAAMPTMSEDTFRAQAVRALTALCVVGIPLSIFLCVHARTIISLVFQRGAFDTDSVNVTAEIMSGQSVGLAFLLLAYTGQKFLNARGRNGIVLRSTLSGVGVSVSCNTLLSTALGPAVLGVSAALAGLTVTLVVLSALQQLRAIFWELRWWWLTSFVHLLGVLSLRRVWAIHWTAELLLGITVWVLFVWLHPPALCLLKDMKVAVFKRTQ